MQQYSRSLGADSRHADGAAGPKFLEHFLDDRDRCLHVEQFPHVVFREKESRHDAIPQRQG
jgi:hypothetical protein